MKEYLHEYIQKFRFTEHRYGYFEVTLESLEISEDSGFFDLFQRELFSKVIILGTFFNRERMTIGYLAWSKHFIKTERKIVNFYSSDIESKRLVKETYAVNFEVF